ncbi:MAG: hypothetical protein PHI97_04020 [Desulfobulbus sp.]|nr:hypothetical protein [Desulfobulbus sp.]
MTKDITTSSMNCSEEEDLELISKAKDDIKEILINHLGAASYEVAEYIKDNFFGGDVENFRSNQSVAKHKSLLRLISEISGETGKSKSWIYDAINLWKDREKIGHHDSYMKISISHRTLLLKVENLDEKKKIADQIVSENLSYKDTKELIGTPVSRNTDYSNTIRLISHPEDLDLDEYQKEISKSRLKVIFDKFKVGQREKIAKKTSAEIARIIEEMEEQQKTLNKLKSFKKNWDSLSE